MMDHDSLAIQEKDAHGIPLQITNTQSKGKVIVVLTMGIAESSLL
jgi:hypothetical protein